MADATDPGLTWGPTVYPKGKPFSKLPAQGRVLGIAGHRTTRLHPFCGLHLVKPGDYIVVQIGKKQWVYRVFLVDLRVNPRNGNYFMHPERFDKARRLTKAKYIALGACTPPRFATWRINVLGRLVAVKTIGGR